MVLKDNVIILLANTRFDSEIKATSLFVARNLSKNNKVYFIDYPFTIKDYLKGINSAETKDRTAKFSLFSDGLLDTDLPNLKIIIIPPLIPINFLPEGKAFRFALKFNEFIISTRIKKILRKNNILEFIYINSFNFHYPNIARQIRPALEIYHCVDPMIIPYDMKHGVTSENQLVKESDLVICTSKALHNEKKKQNQHTYFVPNATDSSLAEKTLDPGLSNHIKIADLPKPIVGYLGTIERRIDYELIEHIVTKNPDKTFVLAGPVIGNYVPDSLYAKPNLYIIGPVPYLEVPQMIKSFDVAMIPFKKDEVSKTIFPIKLFEYLSAGKPVIVTDFNPDLRDFTADLVDYCCDAVSFNNAINHALENNSPLKAVKRRDLAKRNTWENRTDQIAEIISAHLK